MKETGQLGGTKKEVAGVKGMPPLRLDLNVSEAVWDHLYRKQNKRQPASKEEL